jgi:hypothetical protein
MEGPIVFGFLLVAVLGRTCCCLELKNGAYEDFVVKITEGVPVKDCRIVLDNLEVKNRKNMSHCRRLCNDGANNKLRNRTSIFRQVYLLQQNRCARTADRD